MAEQLRLDGALRHRAAVDGDEGVAAPRAALVDGPGDQVLAGAGLAEQQHVGLHLADALDHGGEALDRRGAPHQAGAGGGLLGLQLGAQPAVLQAQATLLHAAAHHLHQALGGEGLLQEVPGALAHRLHRGGDVAVAGDQDHRQVGVAAAHLAQQRHAIHAGHADVADDDPGEVVAELGQGGLGAGVGQRRVAGQLQGLAGGDAQVGLVVDDHHRRLGRLMHGARSPGGG